MRTLDPFAWRTQDVTVYTRIGPENAPHQVLARRLRVFGTLAVHPSEVVEHVPDVKRPESWTVTFVHPDPKHNCWMITHAPTGLLISRGVDNRGYRLKKDARYVAETVALEFYDVLSSLPTVASHYDIVEAMAKHPRYDELRQRIDTLERFTQARRKATPTAPPPGP